MRYFLEENYPMNDNLSMIRQNLHTHCTYCDGKNTLEEMVLAAIDKGFSSLGFSSHCFSNLSYDEVQVRVNKAEINVYMSRAKTLMEVKNDLESRLEELI